MSLYTETTQVSKDVYRLSVAPNKHFEFNQFLIIDDKTCLIHTGKLSLFDPLKLMAEKCLVNKDIDYIVFSHFEADECGSVNKWLELYPNATVVCNRIANISLGEFLIRPPIVLKDGDCIDLGHKKLELIETAHFPHNWDAHLWLEKTEGILFSSDFCCQGGITNFVTSEDISDEIIAFYDKGNFIPYGKNTNDILYKLNEMDFHIIAPMHGSTLSNECARLVFDKVKKDLISRS